MPGGYIIAVPWLIWIAVLACCTPGLLLMLLVEMRSSGRLWKENARLRQLWHHAGDRIAVGLERLQMIPCRPADGPLGKAIAHVVSGLRGEKPTTDPKEGP